VSPVPTHPEKECQFQIAWLRPPTLSIPNPQLRDLDAPARAGQMARPGQSTQAIISGQWATCCSISSIRSASSDIPASSKLNLRASGAVSGTRPMRADVADEFDIDLKVVQQAVSVSRLAAHEQCGRNDVIGIGRIRRSEVDQRVGELKPHLR
jgi:hypothetical protein